MKKEFIPYELALALRELGFDEPCIAFWDAYNGDTHLFFKQRGDYHWLLKLFGEKPKPILEISNWEIEHLQGDGTVLAPTFSQVFRWFREKYDCHHTIQHNKKYVGIAYSSVVNFSIDEFNTYEESELECLKKLIEIVKEM